jgi:hypothetical protein
MKNILKPIYEMAIGELILFDDQIYNFIVIGIISIIALGLAFRFVGMLYDKEIIHGRKAGSAIYWITGFILTFILFVIFSWVIVIVRFILNIPLYVWFVTLGAGVLVNLIIAIIRIRKNKK